MFFHVNPFQNFYFSTTPVSQNPPAVTSTVNTISNESQGSATILPKTILFQNILTKR